MTRTWHRITYRKRQISFRWTGASCSISITGDYILQVEGRCSIGNTDAAGELSVTCKTGPNEYKKHFLGLSDNVTYFAEQLEPAGVDVYRYRVIFKPTTIIPDVELSVPSTQ